MNRSATRIGHIELIDNGGKQHILAKWHIIFYGILLKIVFDISFVWGLQLEWASTFQIDASLPRIFLSFLSILILLLALPIKKDAANHFVSILMFVIIIPMSTIFAFHSGNYNYYILVCLSFLCVEVGLSKIDFLPNHNHRNIGKWVRYAFYMLTIITVIWLFIELGMPTLLALEWSSIYELRASYAISSHLSRFSRITAMTIIPVLFADSILGRRFWISFFLSVAQLLIYLWLGNKIYLFMFPIVFFSTRLAKLKKSRHFILLTLKALVAVIVIITVFEIFYHNNDTPIAMTASRGYSLVVRRAFFVPAKLRFEYFEFFVTEKNPTIGLLGTAISPILTFFGYNNPYAGSSYSQAIGTWLGYDNFANTGIFGGEMAHFGVWGVPIAAMCLLFLLLCIRIGNRRNGYIFTLSSTLFPILYLMNGRVTDIFALSPLAMLIVVLFLYQPMSEPRFDRLKF